MLGSGGTWIGAQNGTGFAFVQPDSGTTPAASGADTLILTSSDSSISITGDAGTKTIDLKTTGGGGGGGGNIIDVGTFTSPSLISSSITAPSAQRTRTFIQGNGGPVTNPTLGAGSTTKEWFLYGTDNTNTVTLTNSISNLILSGTWTASANSMLYLIWEPTQTKWVEAGRNEI